ncbi:MAG: ATP-binding protein [Desulfobulbaceae bacterium]|nr:ATP-binding protein [Desulfobulbaceae bacterium]HIJ89323.1 HAMP domain-containing protein [Deltaproteobacteria bacterium]
MRLNSIQSRLTAIAFFFIIATAVTMGVAGFRLTVNFENERFRDHFSLLASYLASNAELGVLLENKKILEGLTENMLAVTDVQAVKILGKNGEVILQRAHADLPPDLDSVSAPVVTQAMEMKDSPFFAQGEAEEVVGQVVISYSHAGLAQLKRLLAFRFVVVSLLLALVPVVLYWMLSRAISAPLLGLLAVASQVSRGRMDVRARPGSLHETNTLAGAINEMLDALEVQRHKLDEAHAAMARQQVLAEVGKFSMIVAHEIKNPLAIIKGSLEVLKKEGPLQPEMKERMMGFLDGEIERINKLIEDFLLFARPQTPALRPVVIDDLIGELEQRLHFMPGNIQVKRDVPAGEGGRELRCDSGLLERALLNIVRNGLEVSKDEDVLQVRVACTDRRLVFTVEDNGPGVPAEDLPRIFEPFYSTKAKGTGLGLAIAKDVVRAHGGTIAVVNRKDGGACFTVSLPVGEGRS